MSVEENKAVARRLVEGLTDPDILDQIVAEDAIFHAGGEDYTTEVTKQSVARNLAGFPDWRNVVEDIVAEGDKVVVRWTLCGTHTGEWVGFAPTNKQTSGDGTFILRIDGGKVVEWWQHRDMYGILLQLGVIPTWKELVEQANAKLG